ncbi:prephenate dehydratase [Lecanosticta acicola]|uniref:prephenate dehydratase n=1 Tax=Lecanosticta acicola TaxID=111012 RepID=A0AAI9E997_9PEZI|nr:prephenate dehydratase [Lecanosticta acicola]
MEKPAVAYLGPAASYTNQAAISVFPAEEYELDPQATIHDVFRAVQSGEATHGVVPFENSTNGSVIFTLDLLADRHGQFRDVQVEGEIYLEVEHCLVGHIHRPGSSEREEKERRMSEPWRKLEDKEKEATTTTAQQDGGNANGTNSSNKPLYPLDHITSLHSHPQAWAQCTTFLQTHLPTLPQKDTASTSAAALAVSKDQTKTSAAISSRLSAKLYNLTILAPSIQDLKGNSTRFLILRSTKSPTPPLSQPPANSLEAIELQSYKSLICLKVPHDQPGALAACLAVFANHGINLTNFQSRPSGLGVWQYIFFIEFRGRPRGKGEGAVNAALQELDSQASSWKFLGSWKDVLRKEVKT